MFGYNQTQQQKKTLHKVYKKNKVLAGNTNEILTLRCAKCKFKFIVNDTLPSFLSKEEGVVVTVATLSALS